MAAKAVVPHRCDSACLVHTMLSAQLRTFTDRHGRLIQSGNMDRNVRNGKTFSIFRFHHHRCGRNKQNQKIFQKQKECVI